MSFDRTKVEYVWAEIPNEDVLPRWREGMYSNHYQLAARQGKLLVGSASIGVGFHKSEVLQQTILITDLLDLKVEKDFRNNGIGATLVNLVNEYITLNYAMGLLLNGIDPRLPTVTIYKTNGWENFSYDKTTGFMYYDPIRYLANRSVAALFLREVGWRVI